MPGSTAFRQGTTSPRFWSDTKALVDDYFENNKLDFDDDSKRVYDNIISAFFKLSNYDEPEDSKSVVPLPLREYSASVHSFLSQPIMFTNFVRHYKLQEVEGRKKLEEWYREREEEEVTEEVVEKKSSRSFIERARQVSAHAHRNTLIFPNILMKIQL